MATTSDYYKITVRENASSDPFDVDCITKNFIDKEIVKTNSAILHGTYDEICDNIDTRIESDELCTGALWIASADGSILNPGGAKLVYSKNDILYTSYDPDTLNYTTVKVGNIFNSSRMYATINNDTHTMTFYYDATDRSATSSEIYYFDSTKTWDPLPTIKTVIFDESFQNARPVRTASWFLGFTQLETITGIEYLNTTAVIDMSSMFSNCIALENLSVSSFNTARVTTMSSMFNGCEKLSSINMSTWNTGRLTDISYMFASSKIGDVQTLDVTNVTNMAHTFSHSMATTIDVTGWITSNVTDMSYMFGDSANIITSIIGVNDLDTSSVTNMTATFEYYGGTELDISNWDTSNVTTMDFMFFDCNNLVTLDISNFNTDKVTTFSHMFDQSESETNQKLETIYSLNITSWTGNTETTVLDDYMFENCGKLPHFVAGEVDLTHANASNTGYFSEFPIYSVKTPIYVEDEEENTQILLGYSMVFYADKYSASHTEGIVYYDISEAKNWPSAEDDLEDYIRVEFTDRFKNAHPRSCKQWFAGMSNLVRIVNPENLNTSQCTDMESMFEGCYLLKNIDISIYDLSKVVTMKNMFKSCEALLSVNLDSANTASLTTMDHMFQGASKLSYVNMGKMDVSKVTTFEGLFYECVSLSTFITTKSVYEERTGTDGKTTIVLVTYRFDTSKVTTMQDMFWSCKSLSSVDFTGWDVSKVKSMRSMFSACDGFTTIDLRDWTTSVVEDLSYMFLNCRSLTTIYLNNFVVSNVKKFDYMFYSCTYLNHIVTNCRGEANKWAGASGCTSTGMFGRCTVRLPYYEKSNVDISYAYIGKSTDGESGGYFSRCIPKAIKIKDSNNQWRLKFYYDWDDHDDDGGTIYDFAYNNDGTPLMSWNTDDTDIKSVEFTESMLGFKPTSTENWFSGFNTMTQVYGSRYLDMSSCTTTKKMFYNCSALTSLNVTLWDMSKVVVYTSMFEGCSSLVYISSSSTKPTWQHSDISDSSYMFLGCTSLVGAVAYDATKTNINMASLSGYFITVKFDVVKYSIPDTSNYKLVFYYDGDDHSQDDNYITVYPMKDGSSAKAWPESDNTVTTIVFNETISTQNLVFKTFSRWFYGYTNLQSLEGTAYIKASGLTDASYMFYNCSKLTSTPSISYLNSASVDCTNMFYGCVKLTSASNICASNATNMFYGCSELSTASNLKFTGAVAANAFYNCVKLKTLNKCNFTNVTDANHMFYNCISYNEPSVSKTYTDYIIDMPNILDASFMFCNCQSLKKFSTSSIGLTNCLTTESMFQNCVSMEFINFKKVKVTSATNMDHMFDGCDALKHIAVYDYGGKWGATECSSTNMFKDCILLHNFEAMGGVDDRTYAYADGNGYFEYGIVKYVKTPNNSSNATTYTLTCYFDVFEHDEVIGSIIYDEMPLEDTTITSVIFTEEYKDYVNTTFKNMFKGYSSLTTIYNIAYLNTKSSESMESMFDGCSALKEFTVTTELKNVIGTFFDTSKIKNYEYAFRNCEKLTSIPGINVNVATSIKGILYGCKGLTYLDLSSWYTNNVTDMSYAFADCTGLQTIVMAQTVNTEEEDDSWNTSKVQTFESMFDGCLNVNHIYNKNTSAWTGETSASSSAISTNMFRGCVKIAGGEQYDPSRTSKSEAHIFSYFSTDSFTIVWIKNNKSTEAGNKYTIRFYYDKFDHTDEAGSEGYVNSAKFIYNGPSDGYITFCEGIYTSDTITDVEIDPSMQNYTPDSRHCFSRLFKNCTSLTSIKNFENLNIGSGMNDSMFENCTSLETFDFSGNDIHSSKANYLFKGCTKLKTINFGNATFTNCSELAGMFENCTALQSIDLSKFDVNVSKFAGAFRNCTALRTANISGIKSIGSSSGDSDSIFSGCQLLKTFTATKLQSIYNASNMFYQCYSLAEIRFPILSSITNANGMFYDCISLETVYMPLFTGSSCTSFANMFYNCISLESYAFSSTFKVTEKTTNLSGMFYNCMELLDISCSDWDTSEVTNMSYLFFNCNSVTALDVSNWDVRNVTDMSYIFYCCETVSMLDTSEWVCHNLDNLQYAFYDCKLLTSIDLSKLDTNTVRSVHHTFDGCIAATEINANGITTSNVSTMSYAFYRCSSLRSVGVVTWNAYRLLDASHLFDGCTSLTEIQIATFIPIITTAMDYMFNGCTSLQHIYAFMHTAWVGNNATSEHMFTGCTQLPNWDPTEAESTREDKTHATSEAGGYFEGMGYTVVKAPLNDGTYGFKFYFDFDNHAGEGTWYSVFGDNKTWNDGDTSITEVEFCDTFINARPEKLVNWFKGMTNLKKIITPENLNLCEAVNISGMFSGCTSLTFVDGSTWDTGNIDDMSLAFNGCTSLRVIYLNKAKSTSLVDSNFMFSGCNKLQYIFCPYKWTSLYSSTSMFADCSTLDNYVSTNIQDIRQANTSCYFTYIDLEAKTPTTSMKAYLDGTSMKFVNNADIMPDAWYISKKCGKVWSTSDISSITTIVFDGNITAYSTKEWFSGCTALASVSNASKLNLANATDMESMFSGCTAVTSLDLDWNTSNVTNMKSVFSGCNKLEDVDISTWNVSKVTDCQNMFYNCTSLITIYATNTDPWSISSSANMFYNCSRLPNFPTGTPSATDLSAAKAYIGFPFGTGYFTLANTAIPKFVRNGSTATFYYDTSYHRDSDEVYYFVSSYTWAAMNKTAVTTVDFNSSFNSFYPTDMAHWFDGFANLTSITNMKYLHTDDVTDMSYLFNGCSHITTLNLNVLSTDPSVLFTTENVTKMQHMFDGCELLGTLDIAGFDTGAVEDMSYMFNNCKVLSSIGTDLFETTNVTDMQYMFNNCMAATSIPVSNFTTDSVTSMANMFAEANAAILIDVSQFNTSSCTSFANMFKNCRALGSIDVSGFDTTNVTNMASMFEGCESAIAIDVSEFETEFVTNMNSMFKGCGKITALDVSGFDTSAVTNFGHMFDNCEAVESLDVDNFITANATNMEYMFNACKIITELDVSAFSINNVTAFDYMFGNCLELTTIYSTNNGAVNAWNGNSATSEGMFYADSKLPNYTAGSYSKTRAYIDSYLNEGGYFSRGKAWACKIPNTEPAGTYTFRFSCSKTTPTEGVVYEITTSSPCPWRNSADLNLVNKIEFLPNFTGALVYTTAHWFEGFSSLETIEGVEYVNATQISDMSYMFRNCSSLEVIRNIGTWTTTNLVNTSYMFQGCTSLISIDILEWDSSQLDITTCMFDQDSTLAAIYASWGV